MPARVGRPTTAENNPTLDNQAFETTLESLWDSLTDYDKAFIIAFPHFTTRVAASLFIGKDKHWYNARMASRYFPRAVRIRVLTSHEAALSLLKMDLTAKALVRTAIDTITGEIDHKELRSLVRTLTGKVRESKGPSRQGNLVDLASVKTWRTEEEDEDDATSGS